MAELTQEIVHVQDAGPRIADLELKVIALVDMELLNFPWQGLKI